MRLYHHVVCSPEPLITSLAEFSVTPSARSSNRVVNEAVASVLALGWHHLLPYAPYAYARPGRRPVTAAEAPLAGRQPLEPSRAACHQPPVCPAIVSVTPSVVGLLTASEIVPCVAIAPDEAIAAPPQPPPP